MSLTAAKLYAFVRMVFYFFGKVFHLFNKSQNQKHPIAGKCQYLTKKSCAVSLILLNFACESKGSE